MEKDKIISDSDNAKKSGFELPFSKYFALSVGFFFVTVFSVGFLYPISYYMTKKKIENTRIDGKNSFSTGKCLRRF